ncbi:NTP transferase domain-containing protein [Pseudonocardia pini]|uniref:NTP transferase domain-containing protein n=1 Tax=Pseudonocardia pini TaxID=2758030 RepID=UPI001C690B1F|nr:NTP transferase domain-containing protein [Pseudonocardia pini]
MRTAGIVLAGGRSSRMGRPKAWLDWRGISLLQHVTQVVGEVVDGPLVVVRAPGQELPEVEAEVVADPVEGRGPLQGIAAGLAAVGGRADAAFVASVDLPLLHPAYVRRVLDLLGDHDVLLPVVHGHHQPLAAAYRTNLAPLVETLIAEGRSRPPDLLATVDTHRAEAAELLADPALAAADPELSSLLNVNTPVEYAAALDHHRAVSFSEQLRTADAETWEAAVGHRFVDELWAGTVDPAVLRRYLVQDFQFCDAFLALMGGAVATCDDPAARVVHARQVGLVAGDEHDFFHSSFDALGVPAEERVAPALAAPTSGFVELMDSARADASYAEILAVLLVAEWLYLDWADRDQEPPADPVARGWIDLHRGPDFEAWVGFLKAELDRAVPHTRDVKRVSRRFAEAVELERAFFEAAYD